MKEAAKFTRDNPCTKVELWNCFRQNGGYPQVMVVVAKSQIGNNAPKYMLKAGLLRETSHNSTDYYELTRAGISWLEKGITRYLELHPERAHAVREKVPGLAPQKPRSGTRVIIRRRP